MKSRIPSMKSSLFMDKNHQVMERSRTQSSYNNSSVFANSDEDDDEDEEADEKEDVFFSYDLHHTRPPSSSPCRSSSIRFCNSMDRNISAQVTHEKVRTPNEESLISVIDRNMKEHANNLLHAVEGLSARLKVLESRACCVENSFDDLKEYVEYTHERTDGMLRPLEDILREVKGSVQDLRDKQEIAEAQLQLAMLQVSKCNPQSEKQNSSAQNNLVQKMSSSASPESHKSFVNPVTFPQTTPASSLYAPPYHPHHNPLLETTAAQTPTHFLQNQIPSIPQPRCYYPAPASTQETTHQQYHMTQTQQSLPSRPDPHQPYHPASQLPQISQSAQQSQMHSHLSTGSSQVHPPIEHQAEESSCVPSPNYHQTIHYSYSQPPGGTQSTQQIFLGPTQKMHDQTLNRPSSKFTFEHPPSSFNDYNSHTGSPSRYVSSGPSVLSGGNSYSGLPTAKTLPHALPTASSVSGGSGSGETGKRVPIDDVVDKVSAMGFRRDQVRAMVKKLTENGQSVDLNVVLDKLMNDR